MELTVDSDDPAAPRSAARWAVGRTGGRTVRGPDDIRLAVHEAVVNAVMHGGPPVTVSVLERPGALEVVVTDAGRARRDAAPVRPPDERGRGTTLLRGCSDEVEIVAAPAGGRTVRLRYAVAVTPPWRP